MAEEAIKQAIRRCKDRTADLLDEESFNVAEARGKLSRVCDFSCFDKGTMKLVKVCWRDISRPELDRLLGYNDNQITASTIVQIFFWDKDCRKPFYKPKLFYGCPEQSLPDDLQKLVK